MEPRGHRSARIGKSDEKGFTLIELAVVMLIIAILAGLAIPLFLRQRDRGLVAQSQSALANGKISAESYGTEHNGNYAAMDRDDLVEEGFRWAEVVIVEVDSASDGYCIFAIHPQLSGDWHLATVHSDGDPTPDDDCEP